MASLRPTHGDRAVDAVKVCSRAFIQQRIKRRRGWYVGGDGKTRTKRFRTEVGAIARGGHLPKLEDHQMPTVQSHDQIYETFLSEIDAAAVPDGLAIPLDRSVQANPT